MNYKLFFISFESNTWTIYNPYIPKKNYYVFEINKATTKITSKTWLTKAAAIFTHRTSLLHSTSSPASFYSKTKMGYVFSFHTCFGVLIFTFNMRIWMTYLFSLMKNNRNNVRCAIEGENLRNVVWGIIPHYLFV